METKQADSYLSNKCVYPKLKNCEIQNSTKSIYLLRECKIRAKNQRSQLKQQQQQQQQPHEQHLLCSKGKDLQQFPWYLSKSTMISYPRRRKFYEKSVRQGQNAMKAFGKMLHFTDNHWDMHLNAMKIDSFMLKSSCPTNNWCSYWSVKKKNK